MKKSMALCAAVFLCLSSGPPGGVTPAHPFAVTFLVDGHGRYPITLGPIQSIHVRQIYPWGEPYTEVVLHDNQGHIAYFSMDTNELHLQAQ